MNTNNTKLLIIMTSAITSALTVSVLLFTGCQLFGSGAAQPAAIGRENAPVAIAAAHAATDAAASDADAAAQSADDITYARDARLIANIAAAHASNAASQDSPEKTITSGELDIAATRLAGTRPDDAEAAAARARAALVRAGNPDEALQSVRDTRAEAVRQAQALDAARADYAAAIKQRDAARAAELKAVQAITAAQEAARVEEDTRLRRIATAEQQSQALWLRIAGILCVIGVAIGGVLGKLPGLKSTAPLGVGAVALFGLAQLVSQHWFKYAIGVALLAALVVYAINLYKQHVALAAAKAAESAVQTELSETRDSLSVAQETIESIVPVLDAAYDNADSAGKTALDANIFIPLKSAMSAQSRQAIKDVRAAA